MEQQAEIVAAAEAVRTWVLAQRAAWAADWPPQDDALDGDRLPQSTADPAVVPFKAEPASVPAAAADAERFAGETGALPGEALGDLLPPIAEVFPEEIPEPPSLAPFLNIPDEPASVYLEAPRRGLSSQLLGRAAVVLLACGVAAGGGYAAWTRYGSHGDRVATSQGTDAADGSRKAPALGAIQIESTPAGARVLVDGQERGVTPLALAEIPAGNHVVQIESSEGSVRRSVQVASGRTEILNEAIYPGWIRVSAPFEVVVSEAARGIQLDTSNRALLAPGPHTLRIESRPFGYVETRSVVVDPGGITKIDIASPMSTLTVTGPAGGEVLIDGQRAGSVPLNAFPVKVGTRNITIVEPSGVTRRHSVVITSQPTTLDLSRQQP